MRHEYHAQAEKKRWWNEGSRDWGLKWGPVTKCWVLHRMLGGPTDSVPSHQGFQGFLEVWGLLCSRGMDGLPGWWKDTDIWAGTWGGESISLGCFEGAQCSKNISLAHLLLLPQCFSPSEMGLAVYDCHCCLWHKLKDGEGPPSTLLWVSKRVCSFRVNKRYYLPWQNVLAFLLMSASPPFPQQEKHIRRALCPSSPLPEGAQTFRWGIWY